MNQQYAPPQQPHYGGPHPPLPFDGQNSHVPPSAMKPPPLAQNPPPKPGSLMNPTNMPPPGGHNLYYDYNAQPTNPGMPPPMAPANLANQMSNMSLNHPPSAQQNYSAPSNVNGYSTSSDHSPSNPAEAQLAPPMPKGPPPSTNPSLPPGNNYNRYPNDMHQPGNHHPRPTSGPPPPPGQAIQQPSMAYAPTNQPRPPGQSYPPNSSQQQQQNHQNLLSGPPLQPGPPPPQSHQGQQPGQQSPYNVYQVPGQQNMPPQGPGVPPSLGGPPPGLVGPPQNLSGPPQGLSGPPQGLSGPPQGLVGPPQGFGAPPQGPGMPLQGSQPQMQRQGPSQMPPRPGMGMNYPQPGNYPPGGQDYANQRPYGINQQGLNMPGMQQPQQAKRLDPDAMPSPIQVMLDDQKARGGTFATNQKGLAPPFVTTKFVVQDQGNASPRYIRSTIYTVPTTTDIMKQTGVPFGLILSPMASIAEGESPPPIVNMGAIGPVRCIRCKAYMSPFMQFIDAGRRFQCSFCKASTDVPSDYFQHLDHTGQRMDRFERPELMLGTYEFIATTDYCRDQTFPKPPAMIFVIDVSYNTVKSGLVNLLCAEMRNIIKHLPKDSGEEKTKMKIGFITYSSTVHFYNISPSLTQPQMMVVGDVQDVFMPLLDGFLVDVEQSEAVIDSLMQQIPVMFGETRETETILAPAIQAGLEALKASNCVGKLLVFHSSLPIADAPGKLKNRDDRKLLGTDKEKTVLSPQNNVYNNLGQDCVAAGCSVDLFVFNNSYIDIATIGQVCRLTGGEVYKYTYFQADIDGERLVGDIINNINRPIAFDAVMRVRTSTGVRPTDCYGHYFMSNTTDMELASIDCNKAVAVEVKHDDKLTDEEGVYIQVALLYTSCSGIRRLRIINLSLRTSSQMAELYRACDSDAVINFFAKQSVVKLLESTPKAVKDSLVARCATILAAYRKYCASPFSASQLVLPECMKLLPLYANCLLKSDALSGGSDMTIDDRSYVMQAVATMPLYTSVVFFYPRLIPLHDLDLKASELPQQLRCSYDKFTDDGAFLLENGIHMFFWMGLALSPEWIQSVFGIPVVDTDRTSVPVLDNPLNQRVRDIIARVRAERYHCMRLTFVRQRDKLEMVLRHFLVEDRSSDSCPSYVDFLCHMHKEIKTLMSQ